jgi:crossover junction endodeoxyribonuclease RuvC
MLTLGIDPGLSCTGYGIVESRDNRLIPVTYGAIRAQAGKPMAYRLHRIYTQLKKVITTSQPQVVAIEEVFMANNAKSALKLGHARGAAVLAAADSNLPVYEYSALQVKLAVVGYGRADKHQMQSMVQVLLKLNSLPEPHDMADALAVAICHLNTIKIKTKHLTSGI